jgi:uncharacterized membrane protein YqjE
MTSDTGDTPSDAAEWTRWSASWRTSDGDPVAKAGLRRRVERRRRRDLVLAALDAATAVGVTAAAAWFAWRDPQPWRVAWAATLAAFFAVALPLALWNRRGTLRPATQTVRGFLDLSALRARRTLRMLRFLPWFGAAEAAAVLALLAVYGPPRAPARGAALLAFLFLGIAAWGWWLARRTRRELAAIEAARRELDD